MIVIQGAGIAGLSLAGFLLQHNLDYCVVEQATHLKPIGAGITLQANALAVLGSLGLEHTVETQGCWIISMALGPGKHPKIFDYSNTRTSLGVHRASLHSALHMAIPTHRLLLGTTIRHWQQTATGVKITLSNGDHLHARYLIGADGINSPIRQQLIGLNDLRDSRQRCWRTVIDAQPLGSAAFELLSPHGRLGAVPLGNQQTYLYWVQANLNPPSIGAPTLPDYLADFGELGQALQPHINQEINWLYHPLTDRPVYWGHNKVVLIGDAARPVTPNLGQGAAIGMEDAWCLGQLITQNHSEPLQQLQCMRQQRVQAIRRQSWVSGRVAHVNNSAARWLRDQAIRITPRHFLQHTQQRLAQAFIQGMK